MSEQTILAAIAALDSKLDEKLDGLRVDVMRRLDHQSDMISAIRDDIAVNMAATERAVGVADNTRAEVRGLNDIIAAMQRQIRRLNNAVFTDTNNEEG